MLEPLTNPKAVATPKAIAPWVVFTILLIVGIVCFFAFADRVPSLLQALAEH